MVRDGQIYIDLSADGYDDIDLGCYKTQEEGLVLKGNESDSAYGNLIINNNNAKTTYKLQSNRMSFEKYYKIKNHIKTTMGRIENIYIDSEGGRILGTIRITGNRQLTNDEWIIETQITQS